MNERSTITFTSRIFVSLVLALGIPAGFAVALDAFDASLVLPAGIAVCLFVLALVSWRVSGVAGLAARITLVSAYVVGGFFIFFSIIIIPFPLYAAWTSLVRAGAPSGSISFLFVIGISYFSTAIGWLVFRNGVLRPAAGMVFVVLFFITIITRDILWCSAAVVAIVGNVMLVLFHGRKNVPGRIVRTIVPVLIASMLLSAVLSLSGGSGFGFLSYYTLSPGIRGAIEGAFPDIASLSSFAGYAFQGREERLGGRAFLSTRPVFEVDATPGRTIYLRMRVFDRYTGTGWETENDFIERAKTDVAKLEQPAVTVPSICLTMLMDYSLVVPHTLSSQSISVDPRPAEGYAYGSLDTGYELVLPMVKGSGIELHERESQEGGGEIHQGYLDLPPHTRLALSGFIDKIRSIEVEMKHEPGAIGIVNAIIRFLEKEYAYTLSAGYPEAGADFVEDFLAAGRRGYCVHFASAAAVLARCLGIPSRYVTGYVVRMPVASGRVVCTGLSQHAWVELFIPDKGWTTVEATSPLLRHNLDDPLYTARFNAAGDPLTALQLDYFLSHAGAKRLSGDRKIDASFLIAAAVFIFAAMICIAAVFIVRRVVRKRLRYRGVRAKIRNRLVRFVKRRAFKSFPRIADAGWDAWVLELHSVMRVKGRDRARFLNIVYESFYGPREPRQLDLAFIGAFIKKYH